MKEQIRKHMIFSGNVQGVGFRYRSYYMAEKLGLTGWVRNLHNGTVEMEAQGREEDIDALICFLDQTRPIRIEGLTSEEAPVRKREKGFRMLN